MSVAQIVSIEVFYQKKHKLAISNSHSVGSYSNNKEGESTRGNLFEKRFPLGVYLPILSYFAFSSIATATATVILKVRVVSDTDESHHFIAVGNF